MTEILPIQKNPILKESKNFSLLKEKGLEFIQNYAGDVWTDHNLHDPGITLLEAVCFAITDLGFRINLDIESILKSSPSGESVPDFYTAAHIFPTYPLTLRDFRKILIDLPEIKNAWIETESQDIRYSSGEQLEASGLYQVLIELEDHPVLGDLNSSIIPLGDEQGLEIALTAGGSIFLSIEVAFPFWDEPEIIPLSQSAILDTVNILPPGLEAIPNPDDPGAVAGQFFARMGVDYDGGSHTEFGLIINVDSSYDPADLADITTAIIDDLGRTDADSPLGLLSQRITEAGAVLNRTRLFLSRFRNLCEDFQRFRATRIQEIAITANLEVKSGQDIESLLAEMFFEIDRFFAPGIRFYTLAEMLEKGKTTEEIFNGPLLSSGFLDDEELSGLKGRDVIFASDLIRIILERNRTGNTLLPTNPQDRRIISVRNFSISNYLNNQVITDKAKNCLNLFESQIYKPRLSISKSDIFFFREGVELEVDIPRVILLYQELKQQSTQTTLTGLPATIDQPSGKTIFSLDNYRSVQNDLPLTYGTRGGSLPVEASEGRIGKAKQLKAYLLFFDQILANLTAQLNGFRRLLAIDNDSDETYFNQIPDDVALLDALTTPDYTQQVAAINGQSEKSQDRLGLILDHLLARLGEKLDIYEALRPDKAIFNSDKRNFLKAYRVLGLTRASAGVFPLLSDFDIQLAEPTQYTWAWPAPPRKPVLSSPTGATFNLFDLFQELNAVVERGRDPANYQVSGPADALQVDLLDAGNNTIAISIDTYPDAPGVDTAVSEWVDVFTGPWETDRRSTVERKICRLLGFDTSINIYLSGLIERVFEVTVVNPGPNETYGFILTDNNSNPLLLSVNNDFSSRAALFDVVGEVIQSGTDPTRYQQTGTAPNLSFDLLNENGDTVAVAANNYPDEPAVEAAIEETIQRLTDEFTAVEGFHLIEHILLRPDERVLEDQFEIITELPDETFGFLLRDNNNDPLFQSLDNSFDTVFAVQARIRRVIQLGTNAQNYRELGTAPNLTFELVNQAGDPIGVSADTYPDDITRQSAIREMIGLLLPELLAIPEVDGKPLHDITDHYTAQVTVFLPIGAPGFQDRDFRQLVEQTFYRELPAHILPRILWLEVGAFLLLERAYQNWITLWANPDTTTIDLDAAQSRLIRVLNQVTEVIVTST